MRTRPLVSDIINTRVRRQQHTLEAESHQPSNATRRSAGHTTCFTHTTGTNEQHLPRSAQGMQLIRSGLSPSDIQNHVHLSPLTYGSRLHRSVQIHQMPSAQRFLPRGRSKAQPTVSHVGWPAPLNLPSTTTIIHSFTNIAQLPSPAAAAKPALSMLSGAFHSATGCSRSKLLTNPLTPLLPPPLPLQQVCST